MKKYVLLFVLAVVGCCLLDVTTTTTDDSTTTTTTDAGNEPAIGKAELFPSGKMESATTANPKNKTKINELTDEKMRKQVDLMIKHMMKKSAQNGRNFSATVTTVEMDDKDEFQDNEEDNGKKDWFYDGLVKPMHGEMLKWNCESLNTELKKKVGVTVSAQIICVGGNQTAYTATKKEPAAPQKDKDEQYISVFFEEPDNGDNKSSITTYDLTDKIPYVFFESEKMRKIRQYFDNRVFGLLFNAKNQHRTDDEYLMYTSSNACIFRTMVRRFSTFFFSTALVLTVAIVWALVYGWDFPKPRYFGRLDKISWKIEDDSEWLYMKELLDAKMEADLNKAFKLRGKFIRAGRSYFNMLTIDDNSGLKFYFANTPESRAELSEFLLHDKRPQNYESATNGNGGSAA